MKAFHETFMPTRTRQKGKIKGLQMRSCTRLEVHMSYDIKYAATCQISLLATCTLKCKARTQRTCDKQWRLFLQRQMQQQEASPPSWPPGEPGTRSTIVCIRNLYNKSSGLQPSRPATPLNVQQRFIFFGWLEPNSCGSAVRVLFHRFTDTDGANPWCAPATLCSGRNILSRMKSARDTKEVKISQTDTSVHGVSGETTNSLLSSLVSSLRVFLFGVTTGFDDTTNPLPIRYVCKRWNVWG